MHYSEPVRLFWASRGIFNITIDIDGDGNPDFKNKQADGEEQFNLDHSRKIRITGSNRKKNIRTETWVHITNQPVVRAFAVTPRAAVAGEEVTLTWYAPGLKTGVINPFDISVDSERGEYRFTATETMDLSLLATNEFGEADKTCKLDVSAESTDLALNLRSVKPQPAGARSVRIEGGLEYSLEAIVTNNGRENAGGFLVSMYADEMLVNQKKVSVPIGPGGSRSMKLSYTPVRQGKIPMRIVVDPEEIVPDSSRGNNIRSLALTVVPPEEPRVVIGNVEIRNIGMDGDKHAAMLNFDVTQFGVEGKTAYYYEAVVYYLNKAGQKKELARLEGFIEDIVANKQPGHVMRLLRSDDGVFDAYVEIRVMNISSTNGFIDLKDSRVFSQRTSSAGGGP